MADEFGKSQPAATMRELADENEALREWIGVIRDELVLAGFPGGDRDVALASFRELVNQRDSYWKALRSKALDELAAEGEAIESSEDIEFRLRERARIRRQIPNRKSVEEGKPDRIADLLDEAANVIRFYRGTADDYFERLADRVDEVNTAHELLTRCLSYLDSESFPHRTKEGEDRRPLVESLKEALGVSPAETPIDG